MIERPSNQSREVAERVRRLRKIRGWSALRLAEEMTAFGHPMNRSAIAELETIDRHMTVDELCSFSWVLGVTTGGLLGEKALCEVCGDKPPVGFACLNCGANSTKGAA